MSSTEQLERELAARRAALSADLAELVHRVSPQNLAKEATAGIKTKATRLVAEVKQVGKDATAGNTAAIAKVALVVGVVAGVVCLKISRRI